MARRALPVPHPCFNASGILHPFHNNNNAVKLSFDYQIADFAQSFHYKSCSSGGKNMPTFGDIGRLRQEYRNSFQFSQFFSVLLKPAGTQEAQGSRAPRVLLISSNKSLAPLAVFVLLRGAVLVVLQVLAAPFFCEIYTFFCCQSKYNQFYRKNTETAVNRAIILLWYQ